MINKKHLAFNYVNLPLFPDVHPIILRLRSNFDVVATRHRKVANSYHVRIGEVHFQKSSYVTP